MQFTHAGDDGLAGFLVGSHAEGRIFLSQTVKRDTHLLLIGLGLRLDGDVNDGFGKLHLFKSDDMSRIAQGLASGRLFQSNRRGNVAGSHLLDLFALVGMHLQDAADTFLATLERIENGVARIHDARIDAEER